MNAPRQVLRKTLRARRAALDPATRRAATAQIVRHILRHPAYRRARSVALYCAVGAELDLSLVTIAALRAGKRVYLPQVTGNSMCFARFSSGTTLVRGAFGIAQPFATVRCNVNDIDLVIVPLLGFDDDKQRLGQGGGYYDRALARRLHSRLRRPFIMGAAFAVQRCHKWGTASWDVGMDVVIHDTMSTLT